MYSMKLYSYIADVSVTHYVRWTMHIFMVNETSCLTLQSQNHSFMKLFYNSHSHTFSSLKSQTLQKVFCNYDFQIWLKQQTFCNILQLWTLQILSLLSWPQMRNKISLLELCLLFLSFFFLKFKKKWLKQRNWIP